MNPHPGPRPRPAGVAPGGPLPLALYEGVEPDESYEPPRRLCDPPLAEVDISAGRRHGESCQTAGPDALAEVDDKAARRRGKYRQNGPLWCEPPCVLPYHHHGECFSGTTT